MAQTEEIRELLVANSKLVQAIGRKIGSPKTDVQDLDSLISALKHVRHGLIHIQASMVIEDRLAVKDQWKNGPWPAS